MTMHPQVTDDDIPFPSSPPVSSLRSGKSRPGATIGIDIGGTKAALGVVDAQGQITQQTHEPLPTTDYDGLLDYLADKVNILIGHSDVQITGIGLGLPAWMSKNRDVVYQAANLGWTNVHPQADLADRTARRVVVGNDGDCAALGEWMLIGRPRSGPFVMLTLGTGVGGGVIMNGAPLVGAHGIAGELGHITVVAEGRPCVCGGKGCLDPHASGASMLRVAQAMARATPSTGPLLIEACGGDLDKVTGADLAVAAAGGDVCAMYAIGEAAMSIAVASQQLSRVIDHGHLVLGGGASAIGEPLVTAVINAIRDRPHLGPVQPLPHVRTAVGGIWAGVVGAAELARITLAAEQR